MNFSAASICADLDPRNNKRIQVRNGANGLRTKVLSNQQIGAAQTPLIIPPRTLRPRISRLECLEAKMANIEVSLSNGSDMAANLQRHKGVCVGLQENPVSSKRVDSNANINLCVPPQGPSTSDGSINVKFLHHIATLQTKLDEKNSIIASLQEQLNRNNAKGNAAPNSPSQMLINRNRRPQRRVASPESGSSCGEMQSLDGKMHRLQSQIDEKLAIIENLKMQLERMEVHDLDSRICQAELECMLEKEELNALTLQQELMVLKASLEQPKRACCVNKQHNPGEISLYSVILGSQCSTLMALDVAYDPQSPCFYATVHQSGRGLFILWAQDSTRMKKGDRLLEINGQVVWNFRKDDFLEFLHQEATSPLQIALLRNSPPLPLRRDNSKEVVNNLKDEVSLLVNKLDSKIKENKELRIRLERSQKDCDRLKQDNMRLEHRNLYLEHARTSPEMQHAAKPPRATGQKNASNLSLNTSQSRKGDHHDNPLVKAKSVGHLDQVCQKSVNGSRWHVLNVEIPFSTVLNSGPRRNHQDSDSGHCSGDSVDDTVSQVTNNSGCAGNFGKGNATGGAQVPPVPKQRRHIPASVNAAKTMISPDGRIQRKENQQQSIIHLKVKGNTIALDDGGSDHEEWC